MLAVEKLARLGVGCRALFGECGVGGDFHFGRLVFRVRVDPFQDFAVAFPGGKLLLERSGIDAGKLEKPLIERAVVMVFAVDPGDGGAALVEGAR